MSERMRKSTVDSSKTSNHRNAEWLQEAALEAADLASEGVQFIADSALCNGNYHRGNRVVSLLDGESQSNSNDGSHSLSSSERFDALLHEIQALLEGQAKAFAVELKPLFVKRFSLFAIAAFLYLLLLLPVCYLEMKHNVEIKTLLEDNKIFLQELKSLFQEQGKERTCELEAKGVTSSLHQFAKKIERFER